MAAVDPARAAPASVPASGPGPAEEPPPAPPRAVVGVAPAEAHAARGRLFGALEAALPVRFVPRRADEVRGLDALVSFGDARPAAAASAPALPRLVAPDSSPVAEMPGRVDFGQAPELDRRLRGRSLSDSRATGLEPLEPAPGESILAGGARGPLWLRADRGERVALAPAELGGDERLRSHLRRERFLALLPLVHFLREVAGERAWRAPPLRATLVFDDPNLHARRYGHLDFAALGAAAAEADFHLAIAAVPLDLRRASPRAVRPFLERPDRLSIAFHGNDHHGAELGRVRDPAATRRMLAEARARVAAFTAATGIDMPAIMVAPHERCSPMAMRALLEQGFEALAISRDFPRPPGATPYGDWPLDGWEPTERVGGGLPLISRYSWCRPIEDEIVLRAFLDQPIVLYGHHDLLADGPERLLELAAAVNGLGPVRWSSLAAIARASVAGRRDGERLDLRLLARRAEVEVPAGVESVTLAGVRADVPGERLAVLVRGAGGAGGIETAVALSGAPGAAWRSAPILVPPGARLLARLELVPAPRPPGVTRRRRPLRVARRALAEVRDHAAGIAARRRGRT